MQGQWQAGQSYQRKKFIFSKIVMVFSIKRNILSHSPSPGQVMRFGKMCFGSWALIFCLIFGEFLWETIYFTNAFGQERNLIVHARGLWKGEQKIFFLQNLAEKADANNKLSLQWATDKVLQSAVFLMEEKNCFLLPTSALYGPHGSWQVLDEEVSRRMGNNRQRLLTVIYEVFWGENE